MPDVQRSKKVRLGYLQTVKLLAGELDPFKAAATTENGGKTALRFDDFEDTFIPGGGAATPGEGTNVRSFSIADTGWVKGGEEQEIRYDRARTAIGIREIQLAETTYVESSVLITREMKFARKIVSVRLDVDEVIPTTFPSDQRWIAYEVSFDGSSYQPISPENIGQVNDAPLKLEPAEETLLLRLKVTLRRPTESTGETPMLKGYQLKVEMVPE